MRFTVKFYNPADVEKSVEVEADTAWEAKQRIWEGNPQATITCAIPVGHQSLNE